MTQVKLKRIISKKNTLITIIENIVLLSGTRITVGDLDGNVLLDSEDLNDSEPSESYSIICANQNIGYVKGGDCAGLIAEFLSVIADLEEKKKALGTEVLDLYREINLLYNLSDKLGTSLNLSTVAELALTEASRLIPATIGAILLFDEEKDEYQWVASIGREKPLNDYLSQDDNIVDNVRQDGNGIIVNNLNASEKKTKPGNQIKAIICVPLKAKTQTSGVIFLANETSEIYKAADLNFLNTVASQASPAIENAFQYQKAIKESKQREKRLQLHIKELRIELNQAKQEQQVAEITETDYFRRLREQADRLRNIINSDDRTVNGI